MKNIYFWVPGTHILLIKSVKFIHELVTKMTLEQHKINLLDDEQLLSIKQKPNLDQIKNKKIFGCCRFCARLQLEYLTSKFKFQQILRQNSKFNKHHPRNNALDKFFFCEGLSLPHKLHMDNDSSLSYVSQLHTSAMMLAIGLPADYIYVNKSCYLRKTTNEFMTPSCLM